MSKYLIRTVARTDYEQIHELASNAPLGMTNIPRHRHSLKALIDHSERSFAREAMRPREEYYLFVLEDTTSKTLVGMCGIMAKISSKGPVFFYRMDKYHTQYRTIPYLQPVTYTDAPTEIVGLYLTPKHREAGLGSLLSRSRLFFIANEPQRFTSTIIAQLQGFFDESRHCLFWEGIGRNFCDIDYAKLVDKLERNDIHIDQLFPRFPIYLHMLPKNIQDIVGKVYKNTRPALKMLEKEGFKLTNEVDIYDGGPKVEAQLDHIRSIRKSEVRSAVSSSKHALSKKVFLVSNCKINFKATTSPIKKLGGNRIALPPEVLKLLDVNPGDSIRVTAY
ncbi:MAG: arginine N-succinyltransferase [Chlamydiia bacterium]|nr:arginine N-succinyltransferase [Chlamydiia bacterium]